MGLFVTLEGIDGSGKSTILTLLVDKLNQMGLKAIATQEPTKSKIGKILRDYLSNPNSIPTSDALLFAADRVEHYFDLIEPNLAKGFIVICDRYKHSSMVYQGSQGVDINWIKQINSKSGEPDLVVYLDLSISSALNRLESSNRSNIEKFENQKYLEKITQSYLEVLNPENTLKIDAEASKEEIVKNIIPKIVKLLEDRNLDIAKKKKSI